MRKTSWLGLMVLSEVLFTSSLRGQENPLRLSDLLDLARERNPKIVSAGLQAKASSFRIPQEKSLPDPMVGFSLKNMGFPQFTLGQEVMSGIGISFSQPIPFPGKLRLKGEIAEKVFQRKGEVRNQVVLDVLKDVKTVYFDLFATGKSLAILKEEKAQLEKALELTETRYSVGSGAQSDVFKARVEISRMDEMIAPMSEMLKSLTARINLLLDFPPDRPLGDALGPGIESIPLSLEDIRKAAETHSPMIKEAALMVEEGGKMLSLARRELYPNFVVEGGWEYKGRLPSMYEVMIGFEIPLYRRTKQAKMIEESLSLLESSKSGLEGTKNDVAAMVTEDFVKARSAEGLVRLYKEKIIPQAGLAVESSLAGYRVGKTDFLSLLTDINTHFAYQIAYYKELAELWSAIARLEQASGRDIVNWGER